MQIQMFFNRFAHYFIQWCQIPMRALNDEVIVQERLKPQPMFMSGHKPSHDPLTPVLTQYAICYRNGIFLLFHYENIAIIQTQNRRLITLSVYTVYLYPMPLCMYINKLHNILN